MYYTEFIKVCNTKCQNMCDSKVKICRLCFSLHNEDDFVFITPLQTEMVQIVVPELDINISEYVVLCRDCTQNLETIFAFKSAFLEIEDNIHIFRQNDDQQVDLEKAIGIEQEDVLIKAKVCRTCLDFLENNAFIELNNDNAPLMEILKKCLPEMDIGLTKNPVLCRKCVTALENNCEFVGLCMENEKKIRLFVTNSNHCDKVKLEDVVQYSWSQEKTTDNIHTESVIKQENTTNLDNDFPTRNIKNNLNKNRDDILKEFVHSNVSVPSSKDKTLDFLTNTSNIDAMYENDDDVVWEPVLNNIVTLRVGKKSDLSSNSTNVIIQTNENNKNNGNINPPSINSNISETHSGIINKDKAAVANSENTVSITLNSLGCTTNGVQLFDANENGSPDGGGSKYTEGRTKKRESYIAACKSLKNTAESETVSDSDSVYSVGSDNDSDSNNEDFSTADDNPREEITIVTESSSKQPKKNPGLNCKYCRTKIIGSIMRHNLICTGEPFRPKKRSKPSKSKKKAPKPPPPTTNQNPSQPPVTCFIFVANGNEQSSTINACQQAATAFINQQSTMTNTYKQWAMMNMNHGQGNFMLNQPLFIANRNPRFNNSLQQIVESPPLNQLPARENSVLPFPATNLSQPYIIPNSNQQYMKTYNGRQPNRNRPLLPRTDYGPSNNLKPTNNPNTPSRKSVQLKYKGVKKPLATIIKQSVVKQPRAKQADPRHVIDPTPIEAPTATNLLEFPISSETETIEISDSEDTPEPRIVAKNRLMNLLLDKHKPTSLPPEEIQKTKKFVSKMLLPIDKIVKKLPGSSTRRNFIVISDIMVTGAKETNTTSNWSKECHSNTTKGPLETCTSGMTTADTSNDKLIETTTHSKYLTQSEVSCKEINVTSEQEQCEIPPEKLLVVPESNEKSKLATDEVQPYEELDTMVKGGATNVTTITETEWAVTNIDKRVETVDLIEKSVGEKPNDSGINSEDPKEITKTVNSTLTMNITEESNSTEETNTNSNPEEIDQNNPRTTKGRLSSPKEPHTEKFCPNEADSIPAHESVSATEIFCDDASNSGDRDIDEDIALTETEGLNNDTSKSANVESNLEVAPADDSNSTEDSVSKVNFDAELEGLNEDTTGKSVSVEANQGVAPADNTNLTEVSIRKDNSDAELEGLNEDTTMKSVSVEPNQGVAPADNTNLTEVSIRKGNSDTELEGLSEDTTMKSVSVEPNQGVAPADSTNLTEVSIRKGNSDTELEGLNEDMTRKAVSGEPNQGVAPADNTNLTVVSISNRNSDAELEGPNEVITRRSIRGSISEESNQKETLADGSNSAENSVTKVTSDEELGAKEKTVSKELDGKEEVVVTEPSDKKEDTSVTKSTATTELNLDENLAESMASKEPNAFKGHADEKSTVTSNKKRKLLKATKSKVTEVIDLLDSDSEDERSPEKRPKNKLIELPYSIVKQYDRNRLFYLFKCIHCPYTTRIVEKVQSHASNHKLKEGTELEGPSFKQIFYCQKCLKAYSSTFDLQCHSHYCPNKDKPSHSIVKVGDFFYCLACTFESSNQQFVKIHLKHCSTQSEVQ